MNLEWFRTHKSIVYWILAPLVIISFALVFPSNKTSGKSGYSTMGPSAKLTILDRDVSLTPSEVVNSRALLAQFYDLHNVEIGEALSHTVTFMTADALGFEAGEKEMEQAVIDAVKQQIGKREGSGGNETVKKATPEHYHKLLATMQLSPSQFERIVHENRLGGKFMSTLSMSLVNDGKLFVEYCREKEKARLRFRTVKSEDFMAQVQEPAAEKVKEFFDKNSDEKKMDPAVRPIIMSDAKLSAELLYLNTDKLFSELKATDEELKTYWEVHKSLEFKKEPPKAGEPPYPAGQEYKPFDSVKKEVEEKWLALQKTPKANERINKLKKELDLEVKAYKEAESKKPVAEQKPFDLGAWAKKNDLVYWTTVEQTEDVYRNGKRVVEAADAYWVTGRFFAAAQAQDPRTDASHKQQAEEFSYPSLVDDKNPNSGYVITRMKSYVLPKLKTLADAKGQIAEHLKIVAAIDLAQKEAKKIHDNWIDGKNFPDVDTLDEVIGDSKSQHEMVQKFFQTPQAVGEIIPVAQGTILSEIEKPSPKDFKEKSVHKHFYVGFAVERLLPTLKTFEKDTEYNRDTDKRQIAGAEGDYVSLMFRQFIIRKGVYDKLIPSPSLFESIRQKGE